jgi:competence protein ComEA
MRTLKTLVLASLLSLNAAIAAPVDVNSASAQEIADALQGIGAKKAAAIVAYREQNGPFGAVEDLVNVPGIGPKLLENNKSDILLTSPAAQQ